MERGLRGRVDVPAGGCARPAASEFRNRLALAARASPAPLGRTRGIISGSSVNTTARSSNRVFGEDAGFGLVPGGVGTGSSGSLCTSGSLAQPAVSAVSAFICMLACSARSGCYTLSVAR